MDVQNLTDLELLRLISPDGPIQSELLSREIIRSKNLVGDIGEYLVYKTFNNNSALPNLIFPPPGVRNIDFLGRTGDRYSVKSVTSRTGTTGSFWNPESIRNNEKTFEYLLIVILTGSYELDMILQLSWDDFFQNKRYNSRMRNFNISVTRALIDSVEHVFERPAE